MYTLFQPLSKSWLPTPQPASCKEEPAMTLRSVNEDVSSRRTIDGANGEYAFSRPAPVQPLSPQSPRHYPVIIEYEDGATYSAAALAYLDRLREGTRH